MIASSDFDRVSWSLVVISAEWVEFQEMIKSRDLRAHTVIVYKLIANDAKSDYQSGYGLSIRYENMVTFLFLEFYTMCSTTSTQCSNNTLVFSTDFIIMKCIIMHHFINHAADCKGES